MGLLELEHLSRRYGRRMAVDDLSMTVREGDMFGFLGPNGAGKTTTIRVLMGLLSPSEGSARVFGRDPWRESHRIKEEVGYLPGDLRLYPWMTCRTGLRLFGAVRRRDLLPFGLDLADAFKLEPDLSVRHMSRGTRQKLGIVLALAHRPRLLILDEPTSGLDPLMQELLYRMLRKLVGDGHTVFFSSHTLSEVEELCNRVAILREGRLAADEPLDSLRAQAGRTVICQWRWRAPPADVPLPPGLIISERMGETWRGTLTGPARDLVSFCDQHGIEDLSISPPDLSTLFQRHYSQPGASET